MGIDGRTLVADHGQRAMPVWGERYRSLASEAGVEATNFEADADKEMGVLVMETEKQGHVAIHMQRAVFDALFERMRFALEQSTALDSDHSTD